MLLKKKKAEEDQASLETEMEPGKTGGQAVGLVMCVCVCVFLEASSPTWKMDGVLVWVAMPVQGLNTPWVAARPGAALGSVSPAPASAWSSRLRRLGVQLCCKPPREARRQRARPSSCLFWAFNHSCQLATDCLPNAHSSNS